MLFIYMFWGYCIVNCIGGGLLNEKIMSGSILFGENIFVFVW